MHRCKKTMAPWDGGKILGEKDSMLLKISRMRFVMNGLKLTKKKHQNASLSSFYFITQCKLLCVSPSADHVSLNLIVINHPVILYKVYSALCCIGEDKNIILPWSLCPISQTVSTSKQRCLPITVQW